MSDIAALLGRVVAGKFAIEEHVGGGAMGEVFRARHVVLDTAIALKIMRPDIAKDPMFKQRFYREAKAASRLDHANSVRVIDFGVEPDGLVYLAMEFLHGRDLLTLLREEWPIPDARIVDLLVQTLSAVAVAHDLGIVHRDLKPENIMVSVGHEEDGVKPYHVKVCDFGIAKINDPRGFQSESGKALTSSGTLIGTPEYMSPEQARGDPLDARSDLYSIGIVLYQLLVGRVPFSAENALGVVLKQVTDEPVPPTHVRPGVNPRLEAICLRALRKSRDDRYQSAKDMRRDLKGVFGYRPATAGDDSGAHLPAVAPVAPGGVDASSAATIVYAEGHAPTEPGPPGDFSSKGTSDGTEVTLPIPVAHRYLGAILGVAALALLAGAATVVLVSRSGDDRRAPSDASSTSSASSASAANGATAVGAAGDTAATTPVTAPLSTAPAADPIAAGAGGASARAAATVAAKQGAAAVVNAPRASVSSAPAPSASAVGAAAPPVAASPAVDPHYNPSGAYVVLDGLQRERVSESVIKSKMTALVPKLSGCYQSALIMAGAPVPGSAEIHMSIDDRGNVTAIVNAPKHPQFARCAQDLLANQKVPVSALEGGSTMGATATQWLTLHP
ncbi:MAG: eukaryotic-like serine/threonine-protein kinase [Myxococcales bacterium]|nr:eukaryotic-like serine/threonine-protein kinase [Myxococcales bacterium]